jgi:hypothetical protein
LNLKCDVLVSQAFAFKCNLCRYTQAVPLTVRERSAAANASGIRIWPKQGRALVFWSVAVGEEKTLPPPPRPGDT